MNASNKFNSLLAVLAMCVTSWVSAQGTLKPMPEITLQDLSPAIGSIIAQAQDNLRDVEVSDAGPRALAQAYGQLGDALLIHGLFGAAQVAYENAQSLQPERLDWPYLLSVIALDQGLLDQAATYLNEALSLDPWDRASLIRRARLAASQGELDEARDGLERALQLDPESAAAVAGLGEIALQKQDFEQAIEFLEQALALQPAATRLYQPLGLAYRGAGLVDQARAVMGEMGDRDVSFLDPVMDRVRDLSRSPQFYQEAALDAAAQGDLATARTLLIQALTLAPNDPLIVTNYGEVLAREGLLAEAREAFLKLIELQPNEPDAWFYLAQTEELLGRLDAAMVAYQRLVELAPEDVRGSEGLAFVALANGEFDQAAEAFRALGQEADSQGTQYRLRYWHAVSLMGQSNYVAADRILITLNEQSDGTDADVVMARARLQASVLDASADILARALESAESLYDALPNIESAATLAMIHAKLDNYFDAQDYQAQAMFEALREGQLETRDDLKEEMDWYRQEQSATRPFGRDHPIFGHRSID